MFPTSILLAVLTGFGLSHALYLPKIHVQVLDSRTATEDSYDYVVIGGGTSGLTVGDRLSEDGKHTVLVVEYGDLVDSEQVTWVRDREMWKAEPSWLFAITSAPNKELNNLESFVIAGSLVGGSSAINGMQVIRGTRDDYNRWGSFFGKDSTWSWEGMLPYFKKALHFQEPSQIAKDQMPSLKYDSSYWGKTSRLFAGWPTFQWPGIKYQIDLFSALPGVETPEDAGAGKPGVYWYPTFMDGEGSINRSYGRTGHWDGTHRVNYHLKTNSKVSEIELDGENRAVGIIYQSRNSTSASDPQTRVRAKKEVILAAGSFHSPQILQRSGIGPRNLLTSAGIKTKVELPGVGQNLHDHLVLRSNITYTNFTLRPNRRDDLSSSPFIASAEALWEANRTGPYSRGLWNTGAWLPFPVVSPHKHASLSASLLAQNPAAHLPEGTHPDVIAGHGARLKAMAAALSSMHESYYSFYFSGDQPVNYFTHEHPVSAGTVNLNTTHPLAEPVIDYRSFSNPHDIQTMLALARFHREMNVLSPGVARFGPREDSPGLEVQTDEEWIAYLRRATEPTAQHPSGTCAMMPRDLGGVVDEELRVYGTRGLRVVDASTMNLIVGGNICSSVYAIAERAAEMILEA